MWIRIRAVIIEDEPLTAQYLAALLDDTCQVEVVDTAADSESGLRLCAELRPDVVFLDINLPGRDGVSLATQLAMLPQPSRLVFTTGNAGRATDAFRLDAVDYLLKPLDPEHSVKPPNAGHFKICNEARIEEGIRFLPLLSSSMESPKWKRVS